jgi:hypothetical protein
MKERVDFILCSGVSNSTVDIDVRVYVSTAASSFPLFSSVTICAHNQCKAVSEKKFLNFSFIFIRCIWILLDKFLS